MSNLIILFTRYPEPGRCKTRLIPALGAEGAASLHERMTRHTLSELNRLAATRPHRLEIHHDGGSLALMQSWLGSEQHYIEQTPGTIGDRMKAAIRRGAKNTQQLLLVGSDCPGISAEILATGLTALTSCDLVLGPAVDGGYYLIGCQSRATATLCSTLFDDIPWGTNTVLSQTLALAEQHGLRCRTLTQLHDIDTPADLHYLDHYPHLQ